MLIYGQQEAEDGEREESLPEAASPEETSRVTDLASSDNDADGPTSVISDAEPVNQHDSEDEVRIVTSNGNFHAWP